MLINSIKNKFNSMLIKKINAAPITELIFNIYKYKGENLPHM